MNATTNVSIRDFWLQPPDAQAALKAAARPRAPFRITGRVRWTLIHECSCEHCELCDSGGILGRGEHEVDVVEEFASIDIARSRAERPDGILYSAFGIDDAAELWLYGPDDWVEWDWIEGPEIEEVAP